MSGHRSSTSPILRLAARVGALVLSMAWTCASAGMAGRVVATSGETALVRDGFRSSPLRVSAVVNEGDKLVTGRDGRLELRFDDDATVAIGPDSEFRVEAWRFDAQAQRSFFSLARGVIRQVSGRIGKRDPADYRLTTPTGVLAIRGTVFDARESRCPPSGCESGQPAGLSVRVFEGRVAVSSQAGTIEVPAGQAALIGHPAERPALVDPVTLRAPAARASGTPRVAPVPRLGGDGAWLGADESLSLRRDAAR